jgi:glucose-1-phosphate cytidylyltransferase
MTSMDSSGVCASKRIFDLSIVVLLVWLWLPIVLGSAFVNWIFQGRPVFYTSRRRVHRRRIVRLIKFRTMVRDAAKIANRATIPIDDKCFLNIPEDSDLYTPVGRRLERYHFTELPQFFQVALGQMTVVGNRPLPEDVCNALNARFPYAPARFDVLSGMVGPVQLVGRDYLSDEQRLQIEIAYSQACLRAYNWRLDAVVLSSMLMVALRIIPSWTAEGVLSLISLYCGIPKQELVTKTEGEVFALDGPRIEITRQDDNTLMADIAPRTSQTLVTVYPNEPVGLADIPVVVLCGGKGTRAYPYTRDIPKALLQVDGRPIVERVMDLFIAQGYNDFVLSLGHLKEAVIQHFGHHQSHGTGRIRMFDTGEASDTGDRIWHCRHLLGERFIATYADGLCDVNLDKLLEFHDSHDGLVTVTCVPLPSQYGTIEADEHGKVSRFREKPILYNHWINAGYFVFDRAAFEYWEGKNLEQEVLPNMAEKGLLYCYQHKGFFKSMDTHKDQQELEKMFASGSVPEFHSTAASRRSMTFSGDGISS